MGERQAFQPLTRNDRITVRLYRTGIVMSSLIITGLAVILGAHPDSGASPAGPWADILGYGLYASTGICVFFIHLYVGRLKKYLKNLYFIGLGCLVALLYLGNGSPAAALAHDPRFALLLLPLSGCLGFVTAKEAFCFQLVEGYLLAMIMPVYLLLVSAGVISGSGTAYGLILIAAMLVIFTLRKAFMPLAWDIGDKSAYQ